MAAYRVPADFREDFQNNPRRALIITTVPYETRAVNAHLVHREILIGENDSHYVIGRFSDPAGEWIVVHALTAQGNSDAGLVTQKAHHDFGCFNVVMFIGVAGSLKEDIGIGSVVIGDYVYNAHSAKVEDRDILARSTSIPAAHELLDAARMLIAMGEWTDLIRSPVGMQLPAINDYPKGCVYPPEAVIKAIASGEEVVAGTNSPRAKWLRMNINNAAAVEMEGWGVMNAARSENASAIIVRGISDMCAGKDHEKDRLHQPLAAAHAAAFAFSILSFRSKVPGHGVVTNGSATKEPEVSEAVAARHIEVRRVEFVFNFEGSKDEWSKEKVEDVVTLLKKVIGDDNLTLVRVDTGSVRLVLSVRQSDLNAIDLSKLRKAAAEAGVKLLGATPLELVNAADKAKKALAMASASLLAWEKALPNGRWMERPERQVIEARFQLGSSTTVLLGDPGSGKSALLSRIASDLLEQGATVFALKADSLSAEVRTEIDLGRVLQLPAQPSDCILRLAALQPVYVFIDQLDALGSQLDLRSERLNVLLNLVRCIGDVPNVHVLLSARAFEFNHDVRLRTIEAEAVTLTLPPWHDVKVNLSEVGIDPETWPEKARDVMRIPQALKTFIALVNLGRTEPFSTYQSMLEQLWRDRIASADDGDRIISLASDIAEHMAKDETLWLAASRFDDRLDSLTRLEASGFIIWSENKLSVGFSHQTIFEYVLSRTFVHSTGLLSTYVLDRQESLFVRAKLWSALNYLREAEVKSYQREFLEIWKTTNLRRHLRLLLVEFLGQVSHPLDFEKTCMADILNSSDLRIFGLKAIGYSTGWFALFASTAIRDAMSGTDAEAGQALRILVLNWKTDEEYVLRLIRERWLPNPDRDNYSWATLEECHSWSKETLDIGSIILSRSSISILLVEHTAMALALEQPDVALRVIRAKLDYLLSDAKKKKVEPPPLPTDGTEKEKYEWYARYGRTKDIENLLDTMGWSDLAVLAEMAPAEFLQYLWHWYVDVFTEILIGQPAENKNYIYAGQYVLEIELPQSDRSPSREKPLMNALQIAVEELAKNSPIKFSEWADDNTNLEMMVVQQLIACGYKRAAGQMASSALNWLLLDQRRFQLGTGRGLRRTTIDLILASVQHWSKDEIARFEKAVRGYRPQVPDYIKDEPGRRKTFANIIRATKKELLEAMGLDRLAPENRELVASEQLSLGDRFERSMGEVNGGYIGSPMEAAAMAKAKDRDILKIFREIPDNTEWNHPSDWMRGGNVQLSRAFAEFSGTDPERAIRLVEQFEPLQQERAAGYALDAMADDFPNDSRIVITLLDLNARGFKGEEFRDSAARAIEKMAVRGANINDRVVDILLEWLSFGYATSEEFQRG